MPDDRNVTAGRDILPHDQKTLLHPVSIVCAMVIKVVILPHRQKPFLYTVWCVVWIWNPTEGEPQHLFQSSRTKADHLWQCLPPPCLLPEQRITVPVNRFHRRGHVGYTTMTRESKPSIPKSMSKQASASKESVGAYMSHKNFKPHCPLFEEQKTNFLYLVQQILCCSQYTVYHRTFILKIILVTSIHVEKFSCTEAFTIFTSQPLLHA